MISEFIDLVCMSNKWENRKISSSLVHNFARILRGYIIICFSSPEKSISTDLGLAIGFGVTLALVLLAFGSVKVTPQIISVPGIAKL